MRRFFGWAAITTFLLAPAFFLDYFSQEYTAPAFHNAIHVLDASDLMDGSDLSTNLCGQRNVMIGDLESAYGEYLIAEGLVSTDSVVEVTVSLEGTWTILLTKTSGQSCVLAVGEGWTRVFTYRHEAVDSEPVAGSSH